MFEVAYIWWDIWVGAIRGAEEGEALQELLVMLGREAHHVEDHLRPIAQDYRLQVLLSMHNTVKQSFGGFRWWRYCKALWDVKIRQIEGIRRKFRPIQLRNSVISYIF